MSQEPERVYTINLGKVLLSQSQHRAVRAINMIKEFARHHMKVENIKIEEELAHQVWAKGVRSPPRKVRVRMSKTDEGYVLVSPYDEEAESKVIPEKEIPEAVDKAEETPNVVDKAEETPEVVDKAEEIPEAVDKAEETSKVVDKAEEIPEAVDKAEETVKESAPEEPTKEEAPKREDPNKESSSKN